MMIGKSNKAPCTPSSESLGTSESFVSAVASALGGLILEHTVRKGGTIEIPSLGITLTQEDLRQPLEDEARPQDVQNTAPADAAV